MKRDESRIRQIATNAADWLADVAMITDESQATGLRPTYPLNTFVGAVRTLYDTKTRDWGLFGTVWHTGMAIRALLAAHRISGSRKYVEAAVRAARFLATNQNLREDDQQIHGSLMAYEDVTDHYQTSTAMEGILGWLELTDVTGENEWKDRFLLAVNWLAMHAYAGDGLFYDRFNPKTREFWRGNFRGIDYGGSQRPLIDNSVMWHAWRITVKTRYRDIFHETALRLLRDEYPEGTWGRYLPCNAKQEIHARTSYWWGIPLLDAYREFHERKFLDAAIRAAEWYKRFQLLDGGFYYYTHYSGRGHSWNLCGSACGAAVLVWLSVMKMTREVDYSAEIDKAVAFIEHARFDDKNEDPNVRGAIFEKPNAWDNTTQPGFKIRDIGATFAILALEQVLRGE